jgi:hypothetical protein
MTKKIATPQVHVFDDSGDAYDASQCDDKIKDGDVLVVPSERVVGVLIEAWPVAVSTEHGEFHEATEALDWSAVACIVGFTNGYEPGSEAITENVDYSGSVALAQAEIAKLR